MIRIELSLTHGCSMYRFGLFIFRIRENGVALSMDTKGSIDEDLGHRFVPLEHSIHKRPAICRWFYG